MSTQSYFFFFFIKIKQKWFREAFLYVFYFVYLIKSYLKTLIKQKKNIFYVFQFWNNWFYLKLYFSIHRHVKEICHFAIFISNFKKKSLREIFVWHFVFVSLNRKIDSFESFEERIKLFNHLKKMWRFSALLHGKVWTLKIIKNRWTNSGSHKFSLLALIFSHSCLYVHIFNINWPVLVHRVVE